MATIVLLFAGEGRAQLDLGLSLPSSLQVAAGADDDGGRDYSLDLDLGLAGGQRLRFGAGQSRSGEGDDELLPQYVRLGAGSDPLDEVSVAVSLEDWGQEGEITTRTLRAEVGIGAGDWRLTLAPQMRAIRIFFATATQRFGERVEINSESLELRARVFVGDALSLSASLFDTDYSADPSALADAPVALISSVTFDLAAGLEQRGGSLGASLARPWGALSLDGVQTLSAVDDSVTRTLQLGAAYAASAGRTLHVAAGAQDPETDPVVYFARFALGFSW